MRIVIRLELLVSHLKRKKIDIGEMRFETY